MKQKYTLTRNDADNTLTIAEFAELDKESLSLLCEQRYDGDKLRDAIEQGLGRVMAAIRSVNLYPPNSYAERIADKVIQLFGEDAEESTAELIFDDIAVINTVIKQEVEPIEEIEEEGEDLDDLLEDDLEDEFDDADSINPVNSPLKIADDDSLDIDEET